MKTPDRETRIRDALLESLVKATQDAVIFIDERGIITRFNRSAGRIFGYSEDEVVGSNVNILMPEPYAAEHDGYIKHYEETREPRAIGRIRMVEGRRKCGEVFPIELSVTEMSVEDEVSYAAFIRDVSEKMRIQAKLEESRRLAAIGTTAATLAHEVGNPLNNMRLQAQLAARKLGALDGLGDVEKNLHVISEEIVRLSELLEEFRLLSRRQGLSLSDTDLRELVAQCTDDHRVEFGQRDVRVEHELAPDLPLIRADAGKLKQVVLNLCKNAIEAMPEGGTLKLRVEPTGEGRVALELSDTGIGIPEGADIFEPFNTTKDGGTGLGLPIARRIVHAHAGSLTFESREGEGTTFRLELPVAGPTPPEPPLA